VSSPCPSDLLAPGLLLEVASSNAGKHRVSRPTLPPPSWRKSSLFLSFFFRYFFIPLPLPSSSELVLSSPSSHWPDELGGRCCTVLTRIAADNRHPRRRIFFFFFFFLQDRAFYPVCLFFRDVDVAIVTLVTSWNVLEAVQVVQEIFRFPFFATFAGLLLSSCLIMLSPYSFSDSGSSSCDNL